MLASRQDPTVREEEGRRPRGAVGEAGFILGFAGLLPQVVAVAALMLGLDSTIGHTFAFAYAGLIFSFVGGAWWGLVMRRPHHQGAMLIIATLPSLLVAALLLALASAVLPLRLALVLLGGGLMLTLSVDRHLVAKGDAPAGWMVLRTPLSLGLGVLTLIAGVLR
jgi:peptidoglycan/LPS O-acetylase OafA/YrhL